MKKEIIIQTNKKKSAEKIIKFLERSNFKAQKGYSWEDKSVEYWNEQKNT